MSVANGTRRVSPSRASGLLLAAGCRVLAWMNDSKGVSGQSQSCRPFPAPRYSTPAMYGSADEDSIASRSGCVSGLPDCRFATGIGSCSTTSRGCQSTRWSSYVFGKHVQRIPSRSSSRSSSVVPTRYRMLPSVWPSETSSHSTRGRSTDRVSVCKTPFFVASLSNEHKRSIARAMVCGERAVSDGRISIYDRDSFVSVVDSLVVAVSSVVSSTLPGVAGEYGSSVSMLLFGVDIVANG